MLDRDPRTLKRLQAVITALIERRVATSLVDVESALSRWRSGEHGVLAAHGAVLRHAARCERTIERVTAAVDERPEGLLRDAVDAGLISEDEFTALVGKPSRDIAAIGVLMEEEDAGVPDKRRTLEEMLARGPVLVHIDARRAGVLAPPRFRADPNLVLRFGYNLVPAVVDLTLDELALAGTLSFGGQLFHCVLPWAAVYAAVLESESRGMVWTGDVPYDVLAGGDDDQQAAASPSSMGVSKLDENARGHLKLVE